VDAIIVLDAIIVAGCRVMLPAPFTPEFLSRLEALRLRTRREFLGTQAGSYAAPRRGTSLEFADHRQYSPGDDLRYVDWGIFARSDKLYVKLFREEMDLFVYLLIDASSSMAFPSSEQKFLRAGHLALALAYVVLANHDRVRIHFLQETPAPLASPFYRGRHRIRDLISFVASASPRGPLALAPSLAEHLKRLRHPGKAILLSDFLMPVSSYEQGLHWLQAFNLDVSVIQVLSPQELEPPFPRQGGLTVVDSESGEEVKLRWSDALRQEYRERLEYHNRALKSFCHQCAIDYSLFVTGQELGDFVFATLPSIGLFR
jgi:uncharacterized protein (DUF58 family)